MLASVSLAVASWEGSTHACFMQRERRHLAGIRRTGGQSCEWDSHSRRFDFKLRSRAFSAMLSKPPLNESRAFVTHTEGQRDKSVNFQMHETTPPRAEKSKRWSFHAAGDWHKEDMSSFFLLPFPDLTFTHLRRGDLHVDDDGGEGSLAQLRGVVDGVRVQDHQLERPGQFENPLNLTLDLSWGKNTINNFTSGTFLGRAKALGSFSVSPNFM